MTISLWLRNMFGMPARIHLISSDCVCCPVCGEGLDCTDSDVRMFLFGGEIVCPCCSTHLGGGDVPNLDQCDGKFDQMEEWAKLRHAWLEKNNWDEKLMQRVADRLDVKIETPPDTKS